MSLISSTVNYHLLGAIGKQASDCLALEMLRADFSNEQCHLQVNFATQKQLMSL